MLPCVPYLNVSPSTLAISGKPFPPVRPEPEPAPGLISTIYPLRLHATLSLASWHSRPANCTGQQAMSSGPMPFFTTCMCNIERTCVERSYVQCSEMRDSRYPRVDRVLPVETHGMICRIVLHVSS